MTLEEFFAQTPRAAVAFSGGTDSAFVLWAAKAYGCAVRAYYVRTAFQPAFEREDAKRLTELGYRAEKAVAVDMFPRTSHVETVALLIKELE